MKSSLFNIVLLINMIVFDLHASDQKNIDFDNFDFDKQIFTVNGHIASPYSTKFVETLSDAYFAIEFYCINALYVNACERHIDLQKAVMKDNNQKVKWQFLDKFIDDRINIDLLPKHTFCIKNIEKPSEHVPLIMIPEKGLFTLLQYSYGIQRIGTDATILLNENGTEKITVAPLLMKVLNKYREHERIEQ